MASAWGNSWGNAWGNSWGRRVAPAVEQVAPSGGIPHHDYDWHRKAAKDLQEQKAKQQVLIDDQALVDAVAKSVVTVVAAKPERDKAADIAAAERELRLSIKAMQREWADQLNAMIRLEYEAYIAQQDEDMQIAMLLMDM